MDFKDFNNQNFIFYSKEFSLFERLRNIVLNERPDLHANPSHVYAQEYKTFMRTYGKQYIEVHKLIQKEMPEKMEQIFPYASGNLYYAGPLFLSLQGFYPTVMMLGNEEQVKKWKEEFNDLRVVGGYAQTELAHGSDVKSLQTTAVFDPNDKCFILNSPTVKAVKFWPGCLGVFATHVVCQAKMFVKDKSYGIQSFIVQIRDLKTGECLEGIDAGEIGMKLGNMIVDNGYLRFKNYRIPLDALLGRYIRVDETGNVENLGGPDAFKFGYGGMLNLRCVLIQYSLYELTRVTGMVMGQKNRQNDLSEEDKVRFAEVIAFIYSGIFSCNYLMKVYDKFSGTMKTDPKQSLKYLNELHTLAAGFKPYNGWKTVQFLRDMVTKHNGNLYSAGFLHLFLEFNAFNTYEGDNAVLMQQTAREVLKYAGKLAGGKKDNLGFPESASFLTDLAKYVVDGQFNHCVKVTSKNEFSDSSKIEEILGSLVLKKGLSLSTKFSQLIANGDELSTVWNDRLQKEILDLGNIYITTVNFSSAVKEFNCQKKDLKQKESELLQSMVSLQGLQSVLLNLNEILGLRIIQVYPTLLNDLLDVILRLQTFISSNCSYIIDSLHFRKHEMYTENDLQSYSESIKAYHETAVEAYKGFAIKFNTLSKL